MVSNYFSAHWTSFARKRLKEPPERTSLYSFRHTFKDELDRREVPLEVKRALLGHADGGTPGDMVRRRLPVRSTSDASKLQLNPWNGSF